MLAAVYFDNQASFKGDEINNVISDGRLSSKFDAFKVFAFQIKPKAIFDIGRSLSQSSGNLGRSAPDDYATPILTLPRQGRGNFPLCSVSFLFSKLPLTY
jgi:hypothetical protein